MPLNTNDPRYVAEKTPASLTALGARLKTHFGVGRDAFGAKGNTVHYSGFHRSRNWIYFSPDSRYGTSDYSVQGTRNHGGDPDNVSAFDLTPATWGTADNRAKMRLITKRLHDAAVRRDPRLKNWFEFAGTLDGLTVVTFYANGGGFKSPFDPTHRDHLHGSGYRDNIEDDHTGLADIITGVAASGEDDDMSFGPTQLGPDETTHPIPPAGGGAADPRDTWLNMAAELWGGKAGVRVWIGPGNGSMQPLPGYADGLVLLESNKTVSVQLPDNTRILSFKRYAVDATGKVVAPTEELRPWAGPIGVCYERGARK
jgi:hypothetical protein